ERREGVGRAGGDAVVKGEQRGRAARGNRMNQAIGKLDPPRIQKLEEMCAGIRAGGESDIRAGFVILQGDVIVINSYHLVDALAAQAADDAESGRRETPGAG